VNAAKASATIRAAPGYRPKVRSILDTTQPDNLSLGLGVPRHGDNSCNRDGPTAVRYFRYVASSPRYGHSPTSGRSRNACTPLVVVVVVAQLRDLRLADSRQPVTFGRVDPGRSPRSAPSPIRFALQKRRQIAALPQLQSPQLQRSRASVSVAPGRALVTSGVYPPRDIGFHQQLQKLPLRPQSERPETLGKTW
jgi:hypothetical protein